MNTISYIIHKLSDRIVRYSEYFRLKNYIKHLGLYSSGTDIRLPDSCTCPEKIFLYENTNIYAHAKFIINPEGDNGKFIMKKNSGAAEGLTVITGNHHRKVGVFFKTLMYERSLDEDMDVVVEEDVWLGSNVTLLAGVKIGRGATVGANAVCFKSVPPYAIAVGNPAKIIGFCFTPEEIVEHESKLYEEKDRIPKEKLDKMFKKHYLDRLDEISTII